MIIHICTGVDAEGEGIDRNGKLWRWTHHNYCGPLFIKKDGEPLKRQPISENHPAWEPFMRWHKEYEASKRKRTAQSESTPPA